MTANAFIARKGRAVNTTRATEAVDTSGFPQRTYSANLSSVNAVIQPQSGNEVIRYMAERNARPARAYFPSGTDILESDRIVDGTHTYEVVHVHPRTGTAATEQVVVDCEERL